MAGKQLSPDFFDELPDEPDREQIARITLKNWHAHLGEVRKLESRIKALIDEAAKEAARLGRRIKAEDLSRAFERNPSLRKALEKIMATLAGELTATIEQGSKDAWLRSEAAAASIVDQIAAGNATLAALIADTQNKPQNSRALEAFLQRRVGGMNLSDRVWKLVGNTRSEMELAIEVALAEGCPAAELSLRVRELLQDPRRLFRRRRGADGVFRLSKAAAAYHPGRGVYRSSYKNAMRLARTEVNMAYQTADNERWKHSWWVRGIRIQLSNNHTVLDSKGNPQPLVDICDTLAGDYPADFKFTGWHPQCRCFATAITCDYADIRDYYRRKRAGEDMSGYTPPGAITEPPPAFRNWLAENAARLEAARRRGTEPYFIRNNAGVIDRILTHHDKYIGQSIVEKVNDVLIGKRYSRLNTHADVAQQLAESLQKQFGYGVEIEIDEKLFGLESAKIQATEIERLSRRYCLKQAQLGKIVFGYIPENPLEFGEVHYNHVIGSPKILRLTTHFDERHPDKAVQNSRCRKSRQRVAVATHEFGHLIYQMRGCPNEEMRLFEQQMQTIYDEYKNEFERLTQSREIAKRADIFIGLYGHDYINDFIAEAFQEYINCQHPSRYAMKVGKLIDQWFKR